MEVDAFLRELETLLEVPGGSLRADTPLAGLTAWDSMALVGFLAFADGRFAKQVAPARLRECRTVGDLADLVLP